MHRVKPLIFFFLLLSLFVSSVALAEAPVVGKKAARKYFKKTRKKAARMVGGMDHYLAIHLGSFVSDDAYVWGEREKSEDLGDLTVGVTYRMGEWTDSMDFLIRFDFNSYKVDEEKPLKMSLLPMISFPDAQSRFPLYFGVGAGLGVFFKQSNGESDLSLDYQLVAGARFFEVLESTGFFIETGMKNHIHLFSDGQFNGIFATVGTVFSF